MEILCTIYVSSRNTISRNKSCSSTRSNRLTKKQLNMKDIKIKKKKKGGEGGMTVVI